MVGIGNLERNSSGTFSIVKLGKPRNEIYGGGRKKISYREICKIWKANSIKEDHDTSFELHTRCSAFQMRMYTADRKRYLFFDWNLSFSQKKKKVPLVQSLVTISYRFIRLFSVY